MKGAREHNLKNIDVDLPKKRLIVFTGVSGSGKSSLAIDTIFAEGQRRYVESLSAYARQFIGQMEKPGYETIRGLSPTISIEQKSAGTNPRSTVGTITEIYDYLRVLYARVGVQYCHRCGKKVGRGDAESMVEQILSMPPSTRILLLAPIVENRKGEHRDRLEALRREGFLRVRIDGVVQELANVQSLSKHKKHNIEAVVDRLVVKTDGSFRKRLTDSVETALALGARQIIVHVVDREDIRMSEARSCCGFAFPELDPTLFSFNSPRGMCPDCNGLGTVLAMDEDKVVPDRNLSIRQGAVLPWKNYFGPGGSRKHSWQTHSFFLKWPFFSSGNFRFAALSVIDLIMKSSSKKEDVFQLQAYNTFLLGIFSFQKFIGIIDLFHFFFSHFLKLLAKMPNLIRMILHAQLAVGRLDFSKACSRS